MKPLRCAVIGLGMGRHHVAGFHGLPEAEVVAICDTSEERLADIGDTHGIPARYTDAKAMFRETELDLVAIATPNKFHKPLTLDALAHGCHVFCEKPMAMNAKEARTMLAAAKKAKRKLMINFSYRFTNQSWALKQRVAAGELGDIYFGRTVWHRRRGLPGFGGWFGQKKLSGGGPLIDLGVHRLDLALWLMNYPKPVYVSGAAYDPIAKRLAREAGKAYDVEDLAAAFIRFDNGATLVLEASWAANIAESEFMETRLYGTDGGLVQRNRNGTYDFEAELFVERDGAQYDMKLHPPVPSAPRAYSHFVESIVKNKPHTATGEEGVIVMDLLDAIYKSAKQQKPVKVG